MSDNVAIVRGLYEAFKRGDNEGPFEVFDSRIEWDMTRTSIPGQAQVFSGHDGVRRFWRGWLEAWEELEFEVEALHEAGDRVVAFVRQRNRGHGSGIWVDQAPYAQLWELREGTVVRMTLYEARADALRDAGLDPALAD